MAKRALSRAELIALPVSFGLVTAARAWGFGRTKAHELVRRGEFPVRVLRIGNEYRVTKADLLRALGEELNAEDPADGAGVA